MRVVESLNSFGAMKKTFISGVIFDDEKEFTEIVMVPNVGHGAES